MVQSTLHKKIIIIVSCWNNANVLHMLIFSFVTRDPPLEDLPFPIPQVCVNDFIEIHVD